MFKTEKRSPRELSVDMFEGDLTRLIASKSGRDGGMEGGMEGGRESLEEEAGGRVRGVFDVWDSISPLFVGTHEIRVRTAMYERGI